ncbi:TraB/GumN family protein [Ruegeria sediminis]|nr:TraB/GumN family protein [Ruegeria sediminis]
MRRAIATLLFCLIAAGAAQARCTGSDLRDRLTPAAERRLQHEIRAIPFAYGNHWVATRGDRRIHVVGTQHNGDSRMRRIMRTLRPVIRAADAVLLEVTARELNRLDDVIESNPSILLIPRGPTLADMMSAEDWSMLQLRMRPEGMDSEILARLQPWYISLALSRSGCGGRGIAAYAGLDERIERLAVRNGVPVGSLERVGDGIRALSAQPLRDQLRLLELDMKSTLNYDDQIVTMSNAYFEERLAEAMLIQKWTLYSDINIPRGEVDRLLRQYDRQILDHRNRAWLPVIQATRGQVLVVAVGAGHLPGKAGLLNLLKQRGYSLTRTEF